MSELFYGWEHPDFYKQPFVMTEEEQEEALREWEQQEYEAYKMDQE